MKEKRLLSRKWGYLILSYIGTAFVFVGIAEHDLAESGNIIWSRSYLINIILLSLIFGILTGCLLATLLYYLAEGKFPKRGVPVGSRQKSWESRKLFFLCFLLIGAAWLPYFLAYYPGICAYDFNMQLWEITGPNYRTHHPLAHTLLIKAALLFGQSVLGSVNAGIAFFAFAQMLCLAGTFAFGIAFLNSCGIRKHWLCILLAYCMFFPFHGYLSISMTKDVLFSAFFFLQMLALFALIQRKNNSCQPGAFDWLLCVSTAGVLLFRNNGKYAVLLLIVILAVVFWKMKPERKLWGRILLVTGTAFLIGMLCLSALRICTAASSGNKREMMSVPIQQLARCMMYHGGDGVIPGDDGVMEEKEKEWITKFIVDEKYHMYRSQISDPVKNHVNMQAVYDEPAKFAADYLKLMANYPGDFLNAFLALNAGYLYPDDATHALIYNYKGLEGLGYVQTRWGEGMYVEEIHKDSKWPNLFEKMEEWANENAYLDIPLLKYVFVPGTYFWLYLLLTACLLIHRRFRLCVPFALVLGYYITLFLGPAVQLRYLYPVMIVLPFAALFVSRKEEGKA